MNIGLAISGGGANGAFGAGVITRLVRDYGIRFTCVAGNSTGALMASPVLYGNIELMNLMYNGGVTNDQVSEKLPLIKILSSTYTRDSSPLRDLIDKTIDLDALQSEWYNGRMAIVSATGVDCGRLHRFHSHPDMLIHWKDAVLASASVPVFFPWVNLPWEDIGRSYMKPFWDGGLREMTPIDAVTSDYVDEHCNGIDVLIVVQNFCDVKRLNEDEMPNDIESAFMRAMDIVTNEIGEGDLPRLYEDPERKHLDVMYISPDHDLGPSLEFNPDSMRGNWFKGYKQAAKVADEFGLKRLIRDYSDPLTQVG